MKKLLEVKNRQGDLYFERFLLRETDEYEVLLHIIHRADEDEHMHNHSWWFRSTIISGGYTERKAGYHGHSILVDRKPGQSFEMSPRQYHKIEKLLDGPCESIVVRKKTTEDTWGYLVNEQHVPHAEYRELKRAGKLC